VPFRTVCASLVEDGRLTPQKIRKLTRWQILHIYCHARDDKGRLINPNAEVTTYEEKFRQVWTDRGLRPDQVDQKWLDFLKEEGRKAKGQVTDGV
jgi:hypothetical protein